MTARRIDEYYIPTYLHLKNLVKTNVASQCIDEKSKSESSDIQRTLGNGFTHPLMVGISAPQGCGKTTLVDFMHDLFALDDLHCVVMSLDDFYLTRKDQLQLAEKFPENRMLQYRGNAGSHDMPLVLETLDALQNQRLPAAIPRFDKALFDGKGDRSPRDQWSSVTRPVDVVLFEGWMLGFQAVGRPAARALEALSPREAAEDSALLDEVDMCGVSQVDHELATRPYSQLYFCDNSLSSSCDHMKKARVQEGWIQPHVAFQLRLQKRPYSHNSKF